MGGPGWATIYFSTEGQVLLQHLRGRSVVLLYFSQLKQKLFGPTTQVPLFANLLLDISLFFNVYYSLFYFILF